MSLLSADVIRQVRSNTGCPDNPATGGDGYADSQLTDFINVALKEMSRRLPKRTKAYVAAVAGQQDYTLNPAPLYVLEVFGVSAHSLSADSLLSDAGLTYGDPSFGADPSVSVVDHPSLMEVELQQLAHLRRIAQLDWDYNEGTGVLSVRPTPTVTGARIYFEQGDLLTLANIPAKYEPILLMMVEAHVLAGLAAVRARVAGISSTGFPTYGDSRGLMEESRKRKEDAAAMMDAEAFREGR